MTSHSPSTLLRRQDAAIILAAVVLCALAVLTINYNGRKEYQATVRVSLASPRLDWGTTDALRNLLGAYAAQIESVDFAQQVLDRAGFSASAEPARLVQAATDANALVVRVSATHPDSHTAARLAETAATLFVEERTAWNMARATQDQIDVSLLDTTPVVVPVHPEPAKMIIGALMTSLLVGAGAALVSVLRRRLQAKTV